MSKITFRADDDLVDRLEGFEASKSEVMRNALRHYLDTAAREPAASPSAGDSRASSPGSIDRLVDDRIDAVLEARLDSLLAERREPTPPTPDVSVNLALEGVRATDVTAESDAETTVENDRADASETKRKTSAPETGAHAPHASHTPYSCTQCGEQVAAEHVYCPNCGEKAAHDPLCECGDELSSDWAFCPGCGRRTPAADVLEGS